MPHAFQKNLSLTDSASFDPIKKKTYASVADTYVFFLQTGTHPFYFSIFRSYGVVWYTK